MSLASQPQPIHYYLDTATAATLKLLNQSSTNPVIALTYVSYGKWSPKPQPPIVLNDNYVVFGSKTPSASVPRSGSASYNFIIDGTYQLNGAPTSGKTYGLSGNGRLTADFASATTGHYTQPCRYQHREWLHDPVRHTDWRRFHRRKHLELERDQPNARGRRKQDAVQRQWQFLWTASSGDRRGVLAHEDPRHQTIGAGAGAIVGKKN